MSLHPVRLQVGRTLRDFSLEIDGKRVTGVKAVTIRAAVNEVTSVELVFLPGAVEVEGEFGAVRATSAELPGDGSEQEFDGVAPVDEEKKGGGAA